MVQSKGLVGGGRQSERNGEWLCSHKRTSASHRVWVHTDSVSLCVARGAKHHTSLLTAQNKNPPAKLVVFH